MASHNENYRLGSPYAPSSIYNLHALTYSQAAIFPNVTISPKAAKRFAADLADNADLAALVPAIRAVATRYILPELDAIAKLDDIQRAKQALIFAILSPQLKFDHNVRASRTVYRHLDTIYAIRHADCFECNGSRFITYADDRNGKPLPKPRVETCRTCTNLIYEVITRDGGFFAAGSKASYLLRSIDFIYGLSPEQLTKVSLNRAKAEGKIVGMGDKTIALAVHLYDPHAAVYTLDVWMLRFVLSLFGENAVARLDIGSAGYAALEGAFIRWHLDTFGDTLPIFASQWALWNMAGFGYHASHLGIFDLEPFAHVTIRQHDLAVAADD